MKYSHANHIAYNQWIRSMQEQIKNAKTDSVRALLMKQVADAERSYRQFKLQQAQNNMEQLLGAEPVCEPCVKKKKRGRKKKDETT